MIGRVLVVSLMLLLFSAWESSSGENRPVAGLASIIVAT